MPALDEHGRRAQRQQRPRLRLHLRRILCQRPVEQMRRLGQVGRQHVGQWQQARAARLDRIRFSNISPLVATMTGSTTRGARPSGAGLGHRENGGAVVEHAGLGGADLQVAGDGIDLLGDELRRHGEDGRRRRAYSGR